MNKKVTTTLATLCLLLAATWWLLERGNARLRTELERLQATDSVPESSPGRKPTATPAIAEVREEESPTSEAVEPEEEKPLIVPETVSALASQVGKLFSLNSADEPSPEVIADAVSSLPLVVAGFQVHKDALKEPAGAAEFMAAVIAEMAELEPEVARELHELILDAKNEALEQGLVGEKPEDEEAAKEQKARRKAFAEEKHERILALIPAENAPAVEEILKMWPVTDSAMKLGQMFGG